MKKNYLVLIAFFLFFKSNAQVIDFKEVRFKVALLLANIDNDVAKDSQGKAIKIDENDDAEIQLSEALKVSELNIFSSNIKDVSGIENFINLKKLNCGSDYLTELNVSSLKQLTYLDCSGNSIKTLDVSALQNLETLVAAQNSLVSVNVAGLTKLHHLHLDRNVVESLNLSGLTSLKYVDFGYNNLKTLDLTGITKLEDLICNDSKIESLTNLKDCSNLTRLWIQNNLLNTLDLSNCPKLTDLWADNNNLTTIDLTTPKNIRNASLGKNKLTSVNVDDYSNIDFIRLSDNNFTTIDLSKFIKLTSVECSNNKQLTMIFLKNGKDEGVDFEGCTNLKYICNDEIKDSQIERYIKYYNYANITLNSYCSFGPGGNYYTIAGIVKNDKNNNGCDAQDSTFRNLNFNITNGTSKSTAIADASGNFSMYLPEGTYTISPFLENPTYYKISPESINVSFPTAASPYIQNFCVTPNGSHQDLEITLIPNGARPGFDAAYTLVYKNKGNQTKSGSISLDFNDAVLDFVSSVPQITSQAVNKLVWNYENLEPLESRQIQVVLNVNSPMETPPVNINDRLSFNATIMPIANDEKPVDNSFALRQTVVGSFDPNDKTCLEGNIIKPELIGEYVHYLIRFENTGNYQAENIVVKDMIDLAKFDISTLIPTSASHSYTAKITEGNKVEFIFEKINLPFDDAHNDGYIAFKIKTLPTLKVGDVFENEANIYFDYNFPILTNKASSTFSTLGNQDFEFSQYFNIYPNPVKDTLNINTKKETEKQAMYVYDMLGQLVIAVPHAENISNIDVSRLQAGNYILKIKTNSGITAVKFIKY
ncbi:conserved repeat domain-containing protein/Por secretion system C-terminal sorting domain-containing protein [Flavobacterium resistens]|uniref:Conserved repeat domain-containing protein/Por secretion system C-terminal sorting domain-containing protein n=1 Tax=Flavobacterium resistens TaxID=443612 RepID=A0A521AKN3_9FLAO|nr:T9SS type A sorting domain-containing protein [Flavobacterium resistens]MRX69886.1 T9SS type A sorting domain-containing protein [Flavobacterium resistens]SMO35369.1 conserved repeat domain-containing protein/Por secretion system C-terminal sorting domain-containing protein [Flavobacterium resistens]